MPATHIKNAIKRIARAAGFDLRRHTIQTSPQLQLQAILETTKINTVIDVGANEGQFAVALRACGYRGRIISFEPLRSAHERLLRASARDLGWEVASRVAIGDHDGEVDIHVAGNSVSSSILPMLGRHEAAAPGSAFVAVERVPLRRLDSILPDFIDADAIVLLKVDTQGYEDRVLAGAAQSLKSVRAVQLELSLADLYEGQLLLPDMLKMLEGAGFRLHALFPEFVDPETGQTLQVNGVFLSRTSNDGTSGLA